MSNNILAVEAEDIRSALASGSITDAQLLDDYRALARATWELSLSTFARDAFASHVSLPTPPYHDAIYTALQSMGLACAQPAHKPVHNIGTSCAQPVHNPVHNPVNKRGIPCGQPVDGQGGAPQRAYENGVDHSPKSLQLSNVPMQIKHTENDESAINPGSEIIDRGQIKQPCHDELSYKDGRDSEQLNQPGVADLSYIEASDASDALEAPKPHLVIVEPREWGKSTKAMIYVMWSILSRRKHFILYISKSFDHAVKLIGPIKRGFEDNEDLRDVYGDVRASKWTESEMEFKAGSKLLAVGRGMAVRGLKFLNWRPDLVVLDDIEDDKEVENKELRLELQLWLDKQVIPGVDSKRGNIAVFGTVLHPDSLLANLSADKNRLSKYDTFKVLKFGALDPITDKSLWEEKRSTAELHEDRRRDPYTFAQEKMNQPIPLGAGMFKQEYFRYFELDGGRIVAGDRVIKLSSCNLYLTCDLAMTNKEHSDYTVLLVSAVSPDNEIFVLEYTRARWEDPDRIIGEMFRLNAKWPQIKTNGVESVAAQRWLLINLEKEKRKRNHFFNVRALKADQDKLRRISQLQPRFSSGAVWLRNSMLELEAELLLFPKAPHDDVSDALAYVLQIAQAPEGEEEAVRIKPTGTPRFTVSADDVLSSLHNRGKVKGIFKEYQNSEDMDPYEDDVFEANTVKWFEEE